MEAEMIEKCKRIRVLKIQESKIKKELAKLNAEFKKYAGKNNLADGDYYGISLTRRHYFAVKESVDIAVEEGLEIPVVKSLNLTKDRIKELIEQDIFSQDEIEENVDIDKLKMLLDLNDIEGAFTVNLAVGITHE